MPKSMQTPNAIHLWIAQLAHEVNRAYCEALGDTSQVPWHEAPQWQKDSAVDGVLFILDNENATPEESHQNWLKGKLADGWTFGPVKDEAKKEHPCCVTYTALPESQRAKDHIFRAVVINAARGILAITGIPADAPSGEIVGE